MGFLSDWLTGQIPEDTQKHKYPQRKFYFPISREKKLIRLLGKESEEIFDYFTLFRIESTGNAIQ